MTRFSISTDIEAPTDRVWAVISDINRWHEWTPTVTRIEPLDGPTLAVGSRAMIRQPKLPPALWKVTDIQPGKSFTWVTASPGVRIVAHHGVEPSGSGSRATLSLDFQGVLAPLVGWITRGLNERYLRIEADGLSARSLDPAFVAKGGLT